MAGKQPLIDTQTIYSLNQLLIGMSKRQSPTLESCKTPDFTGSLSICDRLEGPLRPEVLALPEEEIQSTFPHKSDAFLGLFRGLKKIALLLQRENPTLPVKNLVSDYGESLRLLLIDQRLAETASPFPRTFVTPRITRRTPDSTLSERDVLSSSSLGYRTSIRSTTGGLPIHDTRAFQEPTITERVLPEQ